MIKQFTRISLGSACLAALALFTLADPVPFPESGTYQFDFETDPFDSGWTLEGWVWEFMPLGVEEMLATGTGDGQVRPSSGGLDDFAFSGNGAAFPLEPLVAAGSYPELGFSGESWLVNAAAGAAVDDGSGAFVVENPGSAKLEFTDLPKHASVTLAMKLGAGGSMDGGASGSTDGPFEILVDGETIFSHQFSSGGGNLISQGVTPLATGANLTTLYREEWNDNGGAGPRSESDRFAIGWVLDSAYDITAMPTLVNIPHSSDELSVEFLHRLTSAANDEHIAIDDLEITLGAVPPPPPNQWPGGDTYFQDFESIGLEWKLNAWNPAPVMSGITAMIGNGNDNGGRIRPSASGFTESAFSGGEPVFPLEPLIEGGSYHAVDPRFEGTWLGSNASAAHNGRAVLFFENLPPHDGIDLDFVLASTDSSGDGDDVVPDALAGGNFQILVDGEIIHEADYNGASGNTLAEEIISQANLTPNYREEWGDGAGDGPVDADDRTAVGWTLDSAYDYTALFDPDGDNPIEHTADSITITFVHGLNSDPADEGIAIDSFQLKLLNASAPVEFEITGIGVDSAGGVVNVTWNSLSNRTYGVDRSFDLRNWDELADGVESGGAETTYPDAAVPAGTVEAYYRVRLEAP